MAQDSKSRKLDQYIVRFPEGMRDRIKAEAEASNRSLNAEIVARLEAYDEFAKRLEDSEERAFIAEGERRYFEAEWKKATAIINEMEDINQKRMFLEAEHIRGLAQKAELDETKEYVDTQMRHMMQARDQNNKQLAMLEKVRGEVAAIGEVRLSLDKSRDEIIAQQSSLIDQLRDSVRGGQRIMKSILKAVDDAARGDTSALDRMVESARDDYHQEELQESDKVEEDDSGSST